MPLENIKREIKMIDYEAAFSSVACMEKVLISQPLGGVGPATALHFEHPKKQAKLQWRVKFYRLKG